MRLAYNKDMTEALVMADADENILGLTKSDPSVELLTIDTTDRLGKKYQPERRITRPQMKVDESGFLVEEKDDAGNAIMETVTIQAYSIKKWL